MYNTWKTIVLTVIFWSVYVKYYKIVRFSTIPALEERKLDITVSKIMIVSVMQE